MATVPKIVRLNNNEETFDWLNENADNDWFIEDEDMYIVEIAFNNHRTADLAKKSLPAPLV